ncbi:MAG TPA: glycine zipper 2TM domain-containing protein [Ramlibacter sp.]|nr:glycine zipper 2TM domain-containing protein [Ramlibacter sp.]
MTLNHRALPLATLVALVLGAFAAHAQTAGRAASAQYTSESNALSARLASDQQLCNGEADSSSRMQCKRDAKADYDKALAAAKARMAAAPVQAPSYQPLAPLQPLQTMQTMQQACADCGRVLSINQIDKPGDGSAVGLIAGGVAGALLGRQMGGGTGKDLATLAGAAGGAFAGREVEKRVNSQKLWSVSVQYPHGDTASYEFAQDPGFRAGDSVRRSNASIVRN